MTELIRDEDLLHVDHSPVSMVFFGAQGSFFLDAMESVSRGHGFGSDAGVCSFWDDMDEYDRTQTEYFNGVKFSTLYPKEQSVVISFAEMLYYIKVACKAYCEDFPSARKKLEEYIEKYVKRMRQD